MKNRVLILFFGIFLSSCNHSNEKLITKSLEVGDKKCTVQQMPEEFHEGKQGGDFDYFRVIIESKEQLQDSSNINLVNFGFENSIMKIIKSDTLYPAFVQRIANGKKENYEYIVSFEKEPKEQRFDVYINDKVLGIGQVTLNF